MIALFPEPIKAWCNGKRVILLGIRSVSTDLGIASNDGLCNMEDGHLEFWPVSDIVTEWHWIEKTKKWEDVSDPEDDGPSWPGDGE